MLSFSRLSSLVVALFAAISLGACEQPDASASDLSSYKTRFGPYEVKVNDKVTLTDAEQERDVTFRVLYPDGEGPFPVVAFSSGAFCFPQHYDNVTEHWASHGYVVVVPNHMDSPNNTGPRNLSDPDLLMTSRVRDISFVLDAKDELEAAVKGLEGKMDISRAAVAGHSFGSMIGLIQSGIPLIDPKGGPDRDFKDERFQAAVLMSGVSQMKQMAEGGFDKVTGPVFNTGGSRDTGNVGDGNIYPWEWRMGGYRLTPPGDKYELALDESDHYLGGMICRDNKGFTRDAEGVMIINGTSTAFLDAYLKGDQEALSFLKTADIDTLSRGRATFSRK